MSQVSGDEVDKSEKKKLLELQAELRILNSKDATSNKKGSVREIDFSYTPESPDEPTGHTPYPVRYRLDPDGMLMDRDTMMKRIRKRRNKHGGIADIKPYEATVLYGDRKPLEEWDTEELARGRPRNRDGSFRGPKPKYVTMAMHEEAIDRFSAIVKTEMSVSTISALENINKILQNEDVDYRGKPVISAGTKLDAAKFLLEHIVGKPKQHIEQDVSIKLQGILGNVIINPEDNTTEADLANYRPAHMPGLTMELASMEDFNNES